MWDNPQLIGYALIWLSICLFLAAGVVLLAYLDHRKHWRR